MVFELDPDEKQRFKAWNEKHMREAHGDVEPYGGPIGGRITFTITGTSIGPLVAVRCNACRELEPELLTDVFSL